MSKPYNPPLYPVGQQNFADSNGGVAAQSKSVFIPAYSLTNDQSAFYTLNPGHGFNDPANGSFYFWRVEQVKPYHQYTVSRIIFTYRDLGQVWVTWTLTGVNDIGQVVTKSVPLGFGNQVPTFKEFTAKVDIVQTAMNQQISVARAPNAGPLSLIQVIGLEQPL